MYSPGKRTVLAPPEGEIEQRKCGRNFVQRRNPLSRWHCSWWRSHMPGTSWPVHCRFWYGASISSCGASKRAVFRHLRDALRNIAERLDTFQPPESSGESASHLNQSTGSLLHAARQVFVSMCAGNENTSSHQPPTSHLASPSNLSNSHHLSTSVTPVLPSQEVLTNQAPLSSSYSAFNTTQPTVQSNSANPTSGTPPMIPLTTGLVHPIAVTVATESSTFHTTCSSTFCIFQFVYSTAIRWTFCSVHCNVHAFITLSLTHHNYAASSLVV